MRRREFIRLAGGAAAWPAAARAQQQAMSAIGFLSAAGPPSESTFRSFSKGLNALGFFEGRNLAIVSRSTERYDQLPTLVDEMIKIPVGVIYAFGSANSARAAKAATSNIPIVFANGGDPVQMGLVASMNRPGGNVTGVTFFSADLSAKRLELLSKFLPSGSLIAFLSNPTNDRADADINEVKTAARRVGLQIMVASVSTVAGIEAAFISIAEHGAKAVLVGGDPFLGGKSDQLTVFAARYQLITSYANRSGVDAGGLMSYSDDRSETYRQAGVYVGRILKGERPADLPVLQPTKFEFVINLTTARTLGLEIPPTLLAIADEVIE